MNEPAEIKNLLTPDENAAERSDRADRIVARARRRVGLGDVTRLVGVHAWLGVLTMIVKLFDFVIPDADSDESTE